MAGEIHRFDAAREIHEKLSELLGEGKRTFFDSQEEELKEGHPEEKRPVRLTSLDIVAWAFLKEELTNAKETHIVKHLKDRYPNLIRFTQFMDDYVARAETLPKEEKL